MIIQFAIYNDNKRNSDKETDCYSIEVLKYESINERKRVQPYFYGACLFNALFSDDTGNLQICIIDRLEWKQAVRKVITWTCPSEPECTCTTQAT
jgi:hypothetical protein